MLPGAKLVGFVATTDLERAAGFYRDVLGLPLVASSPYANAHDSAGTELRVQAVPELQPAGHTVTGWAVDDIAAAIADLRDRGVAFERYDHVEQDEDGVWLAPSGTRVAWFTDPDGNILSLQQSPR